MNMTKQNRSNIFSKLFLIIVFAVISVSAFFMVTNKSSLQVVRANQPVVVNYTVDATTVPGSYYVSGELVSDLGAFYEVGTFTYSTDIIPAIDADRIISGAGTGLDPYVYMSSSIFFDTTYDINGTPELDMNTGASGNPVPLTLSNGDYELSGGFTDNIIVINNGASVVLEGLTIIDDTYNNSFIKVNGGTLTVNDALIYITSSANFGYYNETSTIEINGSNSTVNINGGTLKTYMHFNIINISGPSDEFLNNVTLNINGGTLIGENKQRELTYNQTEANIICSNNANGQININGGTLHSRIKGTPIKVNKGDMDLTVGNTTINYENVLPYLVNEFGGNAQIGGDHGAIMYEGMGEIIINDGIDFNIILDNFHFIAEDYIAASDELFIQTNVIPVVAAGATFGETMYIEFVFEEGNEGTQTILTGSADISTFKPSYNMLNYVFEADTENNLVIAKPTQFSMNHYNNGINSYYYINGIFVPWAKENAVSNVVTIPSEYTSFYGTKAVEVLGYKAFELLTEYDYYYQEVNSHVQAMTVLNLPTSVSLIEGKAFMIDGGNLHIVNYAGTDAELETGVFDTLYIDQGEITQVEYELMADLVVQFYANMGTPSEEIEPLRLEFYAHYTNALLEDENALMGMQSVIGTAVFYLEYPLLFDGVAPSDEYIDVPPFEVIGGKIYMNFAAYKPIEGLDIITTSANYATMINQDEANTWRSYSNNFTYEVVIAFNTNGGMSVANIKRLHNRALNYIQNPVTTDYAVDTSYTLPIPTKAGFIFSGWFSDELLTEEVTEESVLTTNTLFADWISKTLTTITEIEDLTKVYDGEAVSGPTFTTQSDDQIVIEYYIKDGALLLNAPTEVGNYTVKIIASETALYLGAEVQIDFIIKMAQVANNVEQNDWQDVMVDAENGFLPNTVLVVKIVEETIIDFASSLEEGQQIANIYNAELIIDSVPTTHLTEEITLTIKLPENLVDATNIKVYLFENNTVVEKAGVIEDGYITFTTSTIGDFVFSADITDVAASQLWWLWLLLLALLLLLGFGGRRVYIDRRKKIIINNVTNNIVQENEKAKTAEAVAIKPEAKTNVTPIILANSEDEDMLLSPANKKRKQREYGMNKKELIEAMVLKEELSKNAARKFIDAFQEVLVEDLKKNKKVMLEGFVSFELVKVPKRVGINPLTQEKVKIKAHNDVRTKMSKVFKGRFNKK